MQIPLPNWKSAAADLRIVDKPHIDTTQHKEDIHRFWPQGGRLSEVRREHRGTLGGGSRTVWKSSSQGLRPARRLHYFLQATMRATYWAQPGAGLAEPKEVRNKFRTCRMHSCRPDCLGICSTSVFVFKLPNKENCESFALLGQASGQCGSRW